MDGYLLERCLWHLCRAWAALDAGTRACPAVAEVDIGDAEGDSST